MKKFLPALNPILKLSFQTDHCRERLNIFNFRQKYYLRFTSVLCEYRFVRMSNDKTVYKIVLIISDNQSQT